MVPLTDVVSTFWACHNGLGGARLMRTAYKYLQQSCSKREAQYRVTVRALSVGADTSNRFK